MSKPLEIRLVPPRLMPPKVPKRVAPRPKGIKAELLKPTVEPVKPMVVKPVHIPFVPKPTVEPKVRPVPHPTVLRLPRVEKPVPAPIMPVDPILDIKGALRAKVFNVPIYMIIAVIAVVAVLAVALR